jgi:glycosyltransferase involved in cell wall biosynthesis
MSETAPVQAIVDVIIPVFNESESIRHVVQDIPKEIVREIIVVNNGSTDNTPEVARASGATVIDEMSKGYGSACLRGMRHIAEREDTQMPDIVVFLDGDYSDYPEEMPKLLAPIEQGFQMVIGSRALGKRESGAMAPQQIFGNWLATNLIRLFYGVRFTDLGPFRAIRYSDLMALKMEDKTYGWTVEMQVKAARLGMRCTEVAVNYRKRIGVSKITGTIKGTVLAGYKIITTIFKHR